MKGQRRKDNCDNEFAICQGELRKKHAREEKKQKKLKRLDPPIVADKETTPLEL